MAVLREGDLKGFKNYYDNQLKVMSDKLAEKDEVIAGVREKLHE